MIGLTCNHEVAYGPGSNRKTDRAQGPDVAGLARLDRPSGIRAVFGVNLEGPFVPGQTSRGQITYAGYEHLKWEAVVQKMEPERLFSFTWHPYAIDQQRDYSNEPSTLVEFRLEPKGEGTLLTLIESGFSKLPADRRDEAFRMNDGGWTEQMKNIEHHVEKTS
jgi:uncharacterized protein YndB with AHSA1/START domain